MQATMLRAKLHQARVTHADLDYVGSITIDTQLLDQVGMFPYEQVLIANIDNGERFETYILPGEAGSRIMQVNGAAARLVNIGDRLIIMAFSQVNYPPPSHWSPQVLVLDEHNNVKSVELRGRYE
ncbi:MAG: aspartate 1-decarboxylase [Chloroflexi bacterium]|nr:aspartate 1-decarboxylase [Chloroflexota bacterium]